MKKVLSFLFVIMMITALGCKNKGGGGGGGGDEECYNFPNPIEITVGTSFTSSIDAYETKYYVFTPSYTDTYIILLSNLLTNMSVELYEYNSTNCVFDQRFISESDDAEDNSYEEIVIELSEGIEYILFINECSDVVGEFTLEVY